MADGVCADIGAPYLDRPVILPDYAELDLKIPDDARCPAWVCFDGKQVCAQSATASHVHAMSHASPQ